MDSRSHDVQPGSAGSGPGREAAADGEQNPANDAVVSQRNESVEDGDTNQRAGTSERLGGWDSSGVEWDVPPGWRVPWPEPPSPAERRARVDRLLGILTSASTSAAVSLLVLWLWGAGQAGENQSGVTVTYQPLAADAQGQHLPADESPQTKQRAPQASMVPATTPSNGSFRAAGRENPELVPDATSSDADVARTTAVTRSAALVVVTQPEGARVTINGVAYGTTPARIRFLPGGAKRIRVTKDGFDAEERFIGAEAWDSAMTLRIPLRKASVTRRPAANVRDLESAGPRR
jgi:PEGA domain